MTIAAYFIFLALGGLMLYLSIVKPKTWDYRPGVAIALAFALGVSAKGHYNDEAVPDAALVAIKVGEAIAIVLACRYFHYRK